MGANITIVIPVRNRARLVGRTLASIASQTVAPARLILVDNGSTDNTAAVLTQWAQEHDNVSVLSEPMPGAARARNAGLACVETPYVLFFDSDDYMPPHHIEELEHAIEVYRHPEILAFDMNLVDVNNKVHAKNYRHGNPMVKHIFHSILSTQRCVIKTSLARKAGGWNNELLAWNDWEFGVRLLMKCPTVQYVRLSQPVVAYAQTESITGTNFHSKRGEWERALDSVSNILRDTKYARLIDYRRAILAGIYRREHHPEYAKGMSRGLRLKFAERFVAAGGRGVEYLARLLG